MLCHLQQRAFPSNYATNRGPLTEAAIINEAELHSRRLGKLLTTASNTAWKHDELVREVRHAHGAPKRDALDRLAALNASYGEEPAVIPAAPSRFRSVMSSIGSTMAAGAMTGVVLFGLFAATSVTRSAAAIPFDMPADPPPIVSPSHMPPIMSSADAARMRAFLADAVAVLRRIAGDPAACVDHVETIHPVWRR